MKKKLTKRDFAKMAISRLRKAGYQHDIDYDEETFSLRNGRKEMYLYNAYNAALKNRGDGQFVLTNLARTWCRTENPVPGNYEDARPDLFVSVDARSTPEITSLKLMAKDDVPKKVGYKMIGNHIAASIVYDLPEGMLDIGQAELDSWGVDFDQAFADALANLQEIAPIPAFEVIRPGLFRAAINANYNSAFLCFPEILSGLDIEGELVAMVPNRETLLLTGTNDTAGLTEMGRVAKKGTVEPWSRSGMAVQLQDEEWHDFLPHVDHPAYQVFRALQVTSIEKGYANQQWPLQVLYEDKFVSYYTVVERKKETSSYSVWPVDVPSLLPKTDVIVFGYGDSKSPSFKAVRWDDAIQVVGDLVVPLEIYPERYSVVEFPTAAQLAAMSEVDWCGDGTDK